MKRIFLTLVLVLIATDTFAAEEHMGVSVLLPVKARIVNLATMPVEEAIAFCNERSMACPAIREKYDVQTQGLVASDETNETLHYQTVSAVRNTSKNIVFE